MARLLGVKSVMDGTLWLDLYECLQCNVALGMVSDNIEVLINMIEYLGKEVYA